MDFFKSVFSAELDSEPTSEEDSSGSENPNPNSIWSTGGGIIKTLATKSESVIGNYRKDFEEFRSGLKKETDVIREVASRAVKDLPASFEIGASVAQESLESVGQAIDDIGITVWKSTAEIISQGRLNLITPLIDHENSDSDNNNSSNSSRRLSDVKKYSRFEMQLNAIQCNYDTYCTEPEDLEEYERWRQGFVLDDDERSREIESLVSANGVIGEIYKEVVCASELVDEETFWSRYFYRVHKLKLAEEARARLVQRAISMDEEEDLSWDFDDDDDDESGVSLVKGESSGNLEVEKRDSDGSSMKKKDVEENSKNGDSGVEENDDEKVVSVEGKVENGESCKDSDVSLVSTPTQPSMPEEEDLGWDEIEDIESSDENKGGDAVGSTSRVDLQKRLSATEEDEDLSWDIEEDDDNDDEDHQRVKS
ncbi:hypothetical protein Ddye_022032 [Dipteronia dyeriana]|uniref:BSD domain-containing protein n=1 Tax=Dipteronia dyeriana TaxID=168575 RepID=A0AAD9U2V2_9ROSI|nr:hypothetical protein Ddye_022032 [Dipteronia dyeriana]